MAEKLLPCPNPWCSFSSEPVIVASQSGHLCGVAVRHICGIIGPQAEDEESAIVAWNTRPADLRIEAAEKMEKALKRIYAETDGRAWYGFGDFRGKKVTLSERQIGDASDALAAYEKAKQTT